MKKKKFFFSYELCFFFLFQRAKDNATINHSVFASDGGTGMVVTNERQTNNNLLLHINTVHFQLALTAYWILDYLTYATVEITIKLYKITLLNGFKT